MRVSKMEDRRVFCGWLQLDVRPFKHTLMNVIKKWSWMFKEHLLNHVNQRLEELGRAQPHSCLFVVCIMSKGSGLSPSQDVCGKVHHFVKKQDSTM